MRSVVVLLCVVFLSASCASAKSVGNLVCPCPKLPDDCKVVPPAEGECCSTCTTDIKCKPTGDISNVDGVLSWKPNPCEFCSCINGVPQCAIQDCAAPFCDNYVVPEGRCCPVCPPGNCDPTGEVLYDNNILSWKPDPCTYCSCADGQPFCVVQDCAAPPCDDYEVPEGQCCPICNSFDVPTQ